MGLIDKLNNEVVLDEQDSGLIKAGTYHLEVIDVTDGETRNGSPYLELHAVIHGPAYANKHVWEKLWCSTEKSQKITKSQLLAISGNKDVIGDLKGKHFTAEIYVDPGQPNPDGGNYPDRNRLRKFRAYDGSAPAPATKPTGLGCDWDTF